MDTGWIDAVMRMNTQVVAAEARVTAWVDRVVAIAEQMQDTAQEQALLASYQTPPRSVAGDPGVASSKPHGYAMTVLPVLIPVTAIGPALDHDVLVARATAIIVTEMNRPGFPGGS